VTQSILTPLSPLVLLLIAVPVHFIGAVISFWRKSVNASGAVAGAVLGAVIFVAAGPLLWLLMAAFVLSSTGFTRFRAQQKEELSKILEKGGRRDALQVLANGGVGMLMAILLRLTGEPQIVFAMAAAFASANADTWASEIGPLSRREPVSLVTLRRVARGTSGGVSWLGVSATVCGALLIAVVFAGANALVAGAPAGFLSTAGMVTAAGVFGSLIDSLLGCTVQAQYASAPDGVTERSITDGKKNVLIRGLPFVTNDVVNFLSTAAAAAAGLVASLVLSQAYV